MLSTNNDLVLEDIKKDLDGILKNGMTLSDLRKVIDVLETKDNIHENVNNEVKRIKSNLFDYQLEVVNYKRNNLLCNWARGAGSTFTVAVLILLNRPKNVMYKGFGNRHNLFNKIIGLTKDPLTKDYCKNIIGIKNNRKVLEITFKYGQRIKIYDYKEAKECKDIIFDYLIFDGSLPFTVDIPHKQVISFVQMNKKYLNLKQLFPQCHISEVGIERMIDNCLYDKRMLLDQKDDDEERFKTEFDILDEYHESYIKIPLED